MTSVSIGQRVAIARRRRGLSQAVLANLIGRSESWLSQVERGVRSVDRLPVLMSLAEVLHVEVETLLGRPWEYAPNGGSTPSDLEATRHYLNGYRHLFAAPGDEPEGDEPLTAAIARGHANYQAARYGAVTVELPVLLSRVDRLLREARPFAVESTTAYVSGYLLAAKLLRKLGALDLAMLASDRAATVATEGDSDAHRALTAYQVVEGLLRADQVADAETLALSFAVSFDVERRRDEPDLVSAVGALWLIAAVIAARRTSKFDALDRLRQAEALADLLGRDANYGWTAFGPTNVAIHRVSVAAELGEAGEALSAAQSVHLDQLPAGLTGRRAQLHIELAWAYPHFRAGSTTVRFARRKPLQPW